MKRRLFLAGLVPAAALSNAAALFNPDHEGHGKERGRDHHEDEDSGGPRHQKASIRYFRPEDRVLLRRNYPVRSLPPGLRKKYARTGTLPPGWEKRVQPLPYAVVEMLPPLPPNCDRGYVDGYAVVYDRATRVILDTVDLIGALTGR